MLNEQLLYRCMCVYIYTLYTYIAPGSEQLITKSVLTEDLEVR